MKKNRLTMISMLALFVMAAFTFSTTNAQETKEEKKVIKIKMTADDDGEVTIDTTFMLDENFDGDWKALVADEEMLEKLEEMDIQIDVDGGNVMKYTIVMDGEKHEHNGDVMVWTSDSEGSEEYEILIEKIEGDSTMVFVTSSAGACAHGKAITKTIEIETDDEGNIIRKEISSGGENYFFGDEDFEVIELKDHHGAMFFMSTIKISDPDDGEMGMLADADVKMGKEALHLHDLIISKDKDNIKLEFYANELKNLSVAVYNSWGKQIYLEELKAFDGKYIREIELSGDEEGDYYLHIGSGKKSLTKKISLN